MPDRVRLSRRAGWRKPENTIVVARPTRWGNPYRWQDYRTDWTDASDAELRRMAVSDFRGLLEGRFDDHTYPCDDIGQLAGFNLACWCPLDGACHADVLLELANAGR